MPSKKKKYNARFPPARIKKIMQSDEEVGKVAQAVPVIISRALELFVESLLKKAEVVTQARNAKTLTPSHLKQCIMMEGRFDFLRDLVSTVSDVQGEDDGGSGAEVGGRAGGTNEGETYSYPAHQGVIQTTGTVPSTSSAASTATRPEVGQHPLPSYASGIPDYLSLQQNQQVQQHQHPYLKTESAGASGGPNMYIPQAAAASSTMTNNSNQQQQQQHIQHSQPIYHTGQPSQVIIHHDSYIPQHHPGAGGYAHPQHPEHGRHFFYGQYDHSNGQVKPEPPADNTQAYGEHGGYGYDRSGQHY